MKKFRWDELSQYSHYMDFPSNTFAVQGQGTYMLYLEQKIMGKLSHSSKNPWSPQKLNPAKLSYLYMVESSWKNTQDFRNFRKLISPIISHYTVIITVVVYYNGLAYECMVFR